MNYINFLYGTICSIMSAWILFIAIMLLVSIQFIKVGAFLIVPYLIGAIGIFAIGIFFAWYSFRIFFPRKEEYII